MVLFPNMNSNIICFNFFTHCLLVQGKTSEFMLYCDGVSNLVGFLKRLVSLYLKLSHYICWMANKYLVLQIILFAVYFYQTPNFAAAIITFDVCSILNKYWFWPWSQLHYWYYLYRISGFFRGMFFCESEPRAVYKI